MSDSIVCYIQLPRFHDHGCALHLHLQLRARLAAQHDQHRVQTGLQRTGEERCRHRRQVLTLRIGSLRRFRRGKHPRTMSFSE